MSKLFKASQGKLNMWRNCHYAYYLKYVLNLVPKTKIAPFVRGGAIHLGIEYWNSGRSWKDAHKELLEEFKGYLDEEKVMMGDIPGMVYNLLHNYTTYYEDEPYEYISNEQEFNIKIPGAPLLLEGYIDSIIKDEDKPTKWAKETKTYKRMPDMDFLMFNQQASIYTYAGWELGHTEIAGTMWDIIKAKDPTKPVLTQTGRLSTKALDSTPLTVREGLIELGLDPKNYEDYLAQYSYSGYFVRQLVRTNKHVVKSVMDDVKSSMYQMQRDGGLVKDKNLTRDCSYCSYNSICRAELMGLDTDFIIKKGFKEKEEKDNGKKAKRG